MIENISLNDLCKKIELQKFLFHQKPNRLELLNYNPIKKPDFKISVYRNHSFELIENTIKAYLDYANIGAKFIYSDYDDSLSFNNIDTTSDLIIIWLDFSRYKKINLKSFLMERLVYLKTIFDKPILLVGIGLDIDLPELNGVYNINLEPLQTIFGDNFYDERMLSFTGTRLSNSACLKISKELGLKYIPSALLPNIKAIVVDLDNTLYSGVLGEDGISGISLTEGHKNLQKLLKNLGTKGVFVCIASKNNFEDVKKMFETKKDFNISFSDITKFCVSWNDKSDSINEIAKELNINPDSIMFIDDNIGEIISVQAKYPEIKYILADDNADITKNILENYPGIYKYFYSDTDLIRNNDIKLNNKRKAAQEVLSKEDYIRSLEIELGYNINNKDEIKRISELANKTNQFIFSYKRYSQSQVEKLINDKNYSVVSISLKDKLSDSGLIGVIIARKEEGYCLIEEVFISCRALGRGIEDIMIFQGINLALKDLSRNLLKINFNKGERNQPAEDFVKLYLSNYIEKENIFDYNFESRELNLRIVEW